MTINKATRSVDLFNTIRGAAVAMMAQTPESPDLQERLRKLQTTLAEYLGSAASEGILVEPDPIETEDSGTYGGGEMPSVSRADVLRWAEQRAYDAPMYADGIAELWEAYLNRACMDSEACEVCISSLDVMMLLALAEIAHIADGTATMDSFIELAACAARGGECVDG